MYPDRYGADEPTNVSLTDSNSDGWERLRPEPARAGSPRPAYATVGQSAISAMFMYTSYDSSNGSQLLSPQEFLNVDPDGSVNSSDPIHYDLPVSEGWEGDRMHVYENPDAGANETAYVWRSVWESETDAREFADGYRDLLEYWGAQRTDYAGVWTIPEGTTFADAFYVSVDGDTVTVVNAPSVEELPSVSETAELEEVATPTDTATPTDAGMTATPTDAGITTDTPTATDTEMATDTPVNTTAADTTSGSGPGFGVVAAVLALVGALLLVRRRE